MTLSHSLDAAGDLARLEKNIANAVQLTSAESYAKSLNQMQAVVLQRPKGYTWAKEAIRTVFSHIRISATVRQVQMMHNELMELSFRFNMADRGDGPDNAPILFDDSITGPFDMERLNEDDTSGHERQECDAGFYNDVLAQKLHGPLTDTAAGEASFVWAGNYFARDLDRKIRKTEVRSDVLKILGQPAPEVRQIRQTITGLRDQMNVLVSDYSLAAFLRNWNDCGSGRSQKHPAAKECVRHRMAMVNLGGVIGTQHGKLPLRSRVRWMRVTDEVPGLLATINEDQNASIDGVLRTFGKEMARPPTMEEVMGDLTLFTVQRAIGGADLILQDQHHLWGDA